MQNRNFRIIASLCLCFTLLLPAAALGAKDFSDIKGHWAIPYIQELASQGYINGYPDGTFKPDRTMTKAEFTTALIGILDITPSVPAKNSYADTKTHWARKYIEEAVAHGILVPSESPQGLKPDQNILRSQAAAMIVRALNIKTPYETTRFTDKDDVERSLYHDEIKAAYDAGIISGFPDGTFAPFREMTRAQVCTVLVKMLDTKGNAASPVQAITGSIKYLAVSDELFNLSTNSLVIKSGFSEIPVTSLSVSKDVLTVNAKYVYGLDRTIGNPDVVIGNTRYTISRMVVNSDKLVVYPVSRHIHILQLGSHKYNCDYIKLYVNGKDEGLYLADMTIVDEYTVKAQGKIYNLRDDKVTIEVDKDFYDIYKIQLLPGRTEPWLEETDPVIFRGMSMSDISAIFVNGDTLDLDSIDSVYFFIDDKRYRLSDISIDASASIKAGSRSYTTNQVVMAIDEYNYIIENIAYYKGKFVFYLQEGKFLNRVMFNDSYLDASDITIVKGTAKYDFDDVLVVERNLVRIAGRNYNAKDKDIKCLVNNVLWNIECIQWDPKLEMVKITAGESDDTLWSSQPGQPDDYIFYAANGRKIHQGADKDVTIYISGRWLTFDDVRIIDPSTLTYGGSIYDLIGLRVNIDDDYYIIDETSWFSSGALHIYLKEY